MGAGVGGLQRIYIGEGERVVVGVEHVCAFAYDVAVGVGHGHVSAVDEVEGDVAVVLCCAHPVVACIVGCPIPICIVSTGRGFRHARSIDCVRFVPGVGINEIGIGGFVLVGCVQVIPGVAGIEEPMRAVELGGLYPIVYAIFAGFSPGVFVDGVLVRFGGEKHAEVELPGLALAYAAADALPQVVVNKVGAELVDGECVGFAPHIAAAGVDTHLHLVGAVEGYGERRGGAGLAALGCHPCHLIACGHQAGEMDDVGVLSIVLNGECYAFHQLCGSDVGLRHGVIVIRARPGRGCDSGAHQQIAQIFESFCHCKVVIWRVMIVLCVFRLPRRLYGAEMSFNNVNKGALVCEIC